MDKQQQSPAPSLNSPQPAASGQAAAPGSRGQRALLGLSTSAGAGMGMARAMISGTFDDAAGSGGDPLPFQAQLEAALGMDLSFITAHTGQDDALASLGAQGAAYGEHILLGRSPSLETTAEEVIHAIQTGPRAGTSGALSHPGDPAEQEARSLAQDVAAGNTISSLPQAAARDAIHRSLAPGVDSYGVDDVHAGFEEEDLFLNASPSDKAEALLVAIYAQDIRTICATLAGDNASVKACFQAFNDGMTVEERICISLGSTHTPMALAFAENGRADIKSQIQAVTVRLSFGTDEELLFSLLENASVADRYEIAQDPTLMTQINYDTSGKTRARCLALLEPLREKIPAEERERVFEEIAKREGSLSGGADLLLVRLESRSLWFWEDTEGALKDITAWVQGRDPIEKVDIDAGTPAELAGVFAWMRRTLSADDIVRATALLQNGGELTTQDKIEAADAIWYGGLSRSDDEGIFTAIAEASPDERAELLQDQEQLNSVLARLGKTDQQRLLTMLRSAPAEADSAALNTLLQEIDEVVVSDTVVFQALEDLSTDALIRIRDDDALRARIEAKITRKTSFHKLIGYTGQDTALDGEQLAADNQRLAARIEYAYASFDSDEDLVYRAVIEWQAAGGVMGPEDAPLVTRIGSALFGYPRLHAEVMAALRGEKQLSQLGRLEYAASPLLWTDDAGLEGAVEDVSDEELLREWSNLDEYKTLAEEANTEAQLKSLADFQVDISGHVQALLKAERNDWLELVGTLRARLINLLRTNKQTAARVKELFYYVPREEILLRLERAQNNAIYAHDREGFWNEYSVGVMDTFSSAGPEEDRAMARYNADSAEAIAAEDGSLDEIVKSQKSQASGAAFQDTHHTYVDAKTAVAATTGAIVGAITTTFLSVVTAGSATPALVTLVNTMLGSTMTELTEAALSGEAYDIEAGAMKLSTNLLTELIKMQYGEMIEAWSKLGAQGFVNRFSKTLSVKFGPGTEALLLATSTKMLENLGDIPTDYVEALLTSEGLLREELAGAYTMNQLSFDDWAFKALTTALQSIIDQKLQLSQQIQDLANSQNWDECTTRLVQKGIVDIEWAPIAQKLIVGDGLNQEDAVSILCGLVSSLSKARIDIAEKKADTAATLSFFNTASITELKSLPNVDNQTASEIVHHRDRRHFSSVSEIIDLNFMVDKVLDPASIQIRDQFMKARTVEGITE